jgi:hypothetical protein
MHVVNTYNSTQHTDTTNANAYQVYLDVIASTNIYYPMEYSIAIACPFHSVLLSLARAPSLDKCMAPSIYKPLCNMQELGKLYMNECAHAKHGHASHVTCDTRWCILDQCEHFDAPRPTQHSICKCMDSAEVGIVPCATFQIVLFEQPSSDVMDISLCTRPWHNQ